MQWVAIIKFFEGFLLSDQSLILHNVTIGYTLAIGVAVGIVLVVGNVRPGRQLTRWDELVHDVTEGGDGDDLGGGDGGGDNGGDGGGNGGDGDDADVTEGWESRSRE